MLHSFVKWYWRREQQRPRDSSCPLSLPGPLRICGDLSHMLEGQAPGSLYPARNPECTFPKWKKAAQAMDLWAWRNPGIAYFPHKLNWHICFVRNRRAAFFSPWLSVPSTYPLNTHNILTQQIHTYRCTHTYTQIRESLFWVTPPPCIPLMKPTRAFS